MNNLLLNELFSSKIKDRLKETKNQQSLVFFSAFIKKRALIASFKERDTTYIHGESIIITGKENEQIIRAFMNGKILRNVDLYSYLIKGEMPSGIQLIDQDIVVVPTRLSTVSIDSQVFNPGIFETNRGVWYKYASGVTPL